MRTEWVSLGEGEIAGGLERKEVREGYRREERLLVKASIGHKPIVLTKVGGTGPLTR